MEGGAMVSTGRGPKTFKAQTQSGMFVEGSHWPLLVDGRQISVAPILALRAEKDFDAHREAVSRHGFSLFLKRAKIGASKHVRVRPLFDQWSSVGIIHVHDEAITKDILQQIVSQAGLYKGLGDWRPGGKTPGPYGMFTATVTN